MALLPIFIGEKNKTHTYHHRHRQVPGILISFPRPPRVFGNVIYGKLILLVKLTKAPLLAASGVIVRYLVLNQAASTL